MQTLIELREMYAEKGFDTNGYLILNSVGKPATYHDVERTLKNICKALGLQHISLHVLRHYFASRRIANGAEVLVLSKHLGHSRPSITLNVYSHVMDKQQNEFNALLEAL